MPFPSPPPSCLLLLAMWWAWPTHILLAQNDLVRQSQVISDDFSQDSRANYVLRGEQTWEEGTLGLASGTKLLKPVPGSPWFQFDLQWIVPEPSEDLPETQTTLRFDFDAGMDLEVLCSQQWESDRVRYRISLFEDPPGGFLGRIVGPRRQLGAWSFEEPVDRLSFRYRFGQIELHFPDQPAQTLARAFVTNTNASLERFRLSSTADCRVRRLELTNEMTLPRLDKAQQRSLDQSGRTFDQGLKLYRQGKYREAEPKCSEALHARRQVLGGDDWICGSILNSLAMLHHELGSYEKAEAHFLECLAVNRSLLGTAHPDYAILLSNLGQLYRETSQYDKARACLQEGRELIAQVLGKDSKIYATILNDLATLHIDVDELYQAEPLLLEALTIHEQSGGSADPRYAVCLSNLAFLYHGRGDFGEALPLFLEGQRIQEKKHGREHPDNVLMLNNLAALYEDLGNLPEAQRLLEEVVQLQTKIFGPDHPALAGALTNQAHLFVTLGDYAKAETLLLQAIEIDKQGRGAEHPSVAQSLTGLAVLYDKQGKHSEAETLHLEALRILETAYGKHHRDYATASANLASHYFLNGEYTAALPALRETVEIQIDTLGAGHPESISTRSNLASLYRAIGDDEQAESMFREVISLHRQNRAFTNPDYADKLNSLGRLYDSLGRLEESEALLREAHDSLVSAAEKTIPALSYAQAMRWMVKNRPRTDLLLRTLRRQEKWDGIVAYRAVWESKALISRLQLARSLFDHSDAATAPAVTQLRDAQLKLARLVSATPEPDQIQQYQASIAQANDLKEQLERELARQLPLSLSALSQRDASVEDLLKRLPPGVAVVDFVAVDDWSLVENEASGNQPADGALTKTPKWYQATPVLDAFVLRSDRASAVTWIPVGPAAPIDLAISQWRAVLAGEAPQRGLDQEPIPLPDKGETVQPAARSPASFLRQQLWDKIEPELKDCHTVIVIPAGSLHRLPWAALPGRQTGSYLIEDYAIATAAYGQQLLGLMSTPTEPSQEGLLLVGGIQYDERAATQSDPTAGPQVLETASELPPSSRLWPYLPGTAGETKAIRDRWSREGPATTLSGSDATEAGVATALSQYRYAHLATHGYFDATGDAYQVNLREATLFPTSFTEDSGTTLAARNPLLMTGIVLSGANIEPAKDELGLPIEDDGVLTAEEIAGLNLQGLDLVTLSACETGLGDVAAGEGVMGLQRALHQAGAKSVVASLWKVDDQATQVLMAEFYRQLWDRQQSKLESLRQAQLAMIRGYNAQAGEIRGLGGQAIPVQVSDPQAGLNPMYWAAFQLSGDWR